MSRLMIPSECRGCYQRNTIQDLCLPIRMHANIRLSIISIKQLYQVFTGDILPLVTPSGCLQWSHRGLRGCGSSHEGRVCLHRQGTHGSGSRGRGHDRHQRRHRRVLRDAGERKPTHHDHTRYLTIRARVLSPSHTNHIPCHYVVQAGQGVDTSSGFNIPLGAVPISTGR